MNKFNQELENMSHAEREAKLEELRRELFSLKLYSVTNPKKDYSQFKKLRKNIARTLTCINIKTDKKG